MAKIQKKNRFIIILYLMKISGVFNDNKDNLILLILYLLIYYLLFVCLITINKCDKVFKLK